MDAYPGEAFYGKISQVRLAATTVQNVVTYNAIIDVPNPELKLKPGMTANVKILIEKVANALKFPNSALRFRPALTDAELEAATSSAESQITDLLRQRHRIPPSDDADFLFETCQISRIWPITPIGS